MLKLFDKRSNTDRILEEYPWMWAVRPTWTPGDFIRVRILKEIHECRADPESKKWWGVCGYTYHFLGGFGQKECLEVFQIKRNASERPIGEVGAAVNCRGRVLRFLVAHHCSDASGMVHEIFRTSAYDGNLGRLCQEFMEGQKANK